MSTDTIPANIDQFNRTALTLFSRLYDRFPAPTDIEPLDLGLSGIPDDASDVQALSYAVRAEHVISWLEEEGFIRVQDRDLGGKFYGVRLSLRGLTVLGYIPTVLKQGEEPETMITKVKRALSSGAEKAGAEAVKGLLSELFKLALSSAISQA